mmetsp:Transcript_9410/g.57454  ORF Transcript_9410/g.57454 Transcript_9410/m.57454 type:complete len:263 (-) Transcript_9410:1227-2015(-)
MGGIHSGHGHSMSVLHEQMGRTCTCFGDGHFDHHTWVDGCECRTSLCKCIHVLPTPSLELHFFRTKSKRFFREFGERTCIASCGFGSFQQCRIGRDPVEHAGGQPRAPRRHVCGVQEQTQPSSPPLCVRAHRMSASVRLRHRRSEDGHAHVSQTLDALGFDHTPNRAVTPRHSPTQDGGRNGVYTPAAHGETGRAGTSTREGPGVCRASTPRCGRIPTSKKRWRRSTPRSLPKCSIPRAGPRRNTKRDRPPEHRSICRCEEV